jgi:23S rRNA (pseudouridine1915-N3)-methyltransferase
MKFKLVWVGKTKDRNWLALQNEYLQRLSHFVGCEIVEVRDGGTQPDIRKVEGKRILEKVNQTSFVCLLDVQGRSLSSAELARELEKWQSAGHKEVSFVIGGADGVARDVAARANDVLSLSFLTFTHEMARVVLLEQLYRAFTIIKGFPYQR